MLNKMIANKTIAASRLSLLLLLTLSITACGFHLRGNIPLSEGVKNMYVVAPKGTFKDKLEAVLVNAGAELAPVKSAADVVLNVTKARSDRSVGTIDERGKANSYNLTFNVTYTLDDRDGNVVRKKTNVVETRRYNFDPDFVIESESEERELQAGMEQDAVLRIVRQLATITNYQPKSQ